MNNLPILFNPEIINLPVPFGKVRVVGCPHPFKQEIVEHFCNFGESLLDILRREQPDILLYPAYAWVNDDPVPLERWASTYPAPGSEISYKVNPRGKVGRTIGMVFIAIAAIALAAFTMSASIFLAGGALAGWGGLVGGLVGMATSVIGNLALNALIPPTINPSRQAALTGTGVSTAYGSQAASSPTYSLTGGSNQANNWGPIPKIFGVHKHFPNYGAETYTEIVGEEQYLRLYLIWGISRAVTPAIQIENLKIGDTALGNFAGVEVEHRNLTLLLTAQTIAIDVLLKTLIRTSGSWVADGIKAGDTVTLGGCTTPANNTAYLISAVTALVLTYGAGPATTSEAGNGAQTASITWGDDPLTLYTNRIHEDAEVKNIALLQGEPVIRTSRAGARELSVDISLPSLFANDPTSGDRGGKTVTVRINYRQTGAGAWQTATTLTITAASSSAVRRGYRWGVNAAADPDVTYDVQVTRMNPGADDTFSSSLSYWTALRTIWATDPFNCAAPVAKTILRIKASNELSGTVNKLSGICSGIEPDWDAGTGTWITRITQNPASHLRELAQGPQNMDPYGDDELNLQQLQYFHAYCIAQGWKYNKIVDYEVDFEELWAEISAAGRAGIDWLDCKRGVFVDEPQEFAIGPAFTPRNSNNFSSQIVYPDEVHCWRCAFKNELNDYVDDERLVLLDGFALLDANGDKVDAWGNPAPTLPLATIFKSLPILGVTHPELIFKHARFHGAQLQLRFERHEFDAHLDQLVARRGKRTKFAHPVILAGSAWGRVKSVNLEIIGIDYERVTLGSGVTFGSGVRWGQINEPPVEFPIYTGYLAGVTLDAPCPMEEGTEYAIRFRLGNNVSLLCDVVTSPGNPKELIFVTPIPPYDPGPPPGNYWPARGDLFMFGERGKETIDLILFAIRPNSKLGARISALDYDEAIYLADLGVVPPHDPQVTIPPEWWVPEIAWVRSSGAVLYRASDGSLSSRILVSLAIPGALSVNIMGVEAQYWLSGSNSAPVTLPVVSLQDWEVSLMPVEDGRSYDFRLRYVRKNGSRGPWGSTQTHVVEGKTAPPANVSGFMINQVKEIVNFSWVQIPDLDIAGYEIRYGIPGVSWAAAIPITEIIRSTSFATPMLPPGQWDMLIKAVDTSGNYSLLATRRTFRVMQFYIILNDSKHYPFADGVLTHYSRNPRTGHLNPEDQDPADADNQDLFDHYVVNPYAASEYEAAEIDLGADLAVRAWARIYSALGPGETGTVEPKLQIDHKLAGGSYGGFADWTIGNITARYVKFKLVAQASAGLRMIEEFQTIIDQSF